MTQAIKLLASIDPPRRLLINEQVVQEAAEACPALRSRLSVPGAGNDKYTIGLVAAFSKIWESFEAMGLAGDLAGVSENYLGDTDAILANNSNELSYVFEELPLIVEMIEASVNEKSESKAGIILAFVTTARYLISQAIPAAKDLEELQEDEIVALSEPEKTTTPQPRKGYRPDIRDVVGDLMKAGIPWDMINIVPIMQDGNVSFEIRGTISEESVGGNESVKFDSVARINALFLKATGKGVSLKSESPIFFSLEV